jgi:HPt (histidine-containing phosphotransfer) domain-containing protein
VDEDALLGRLDGDAAFMRELLGYFIEEADGRRDAIAKAMAERDPDSLQRLCHGLKGSALTLRADPIAAAAATVELACMKAGRGGPGLDGPFAQVAAAAEGLDGLLSDTVAAARAILERSGSARP